MQLLKLEGEHETNFYFKPFQQIFGNIWKIKKNIAERLLVLIRIISDFLKMLLITLRKVP